MKLSLMPLLSLISLSVPAHAASLLLEMRTDADSASYNRAAWATGKRDETGFLLQTARLDLKGDLAENLSYRLRFRVNNESTVQGVDALATRVDFASVSHKMEFVTLTLGKTGAEVGGHEGLMDSRDIYLKSEANKAVTGSYNALSTNTRPVFYQSKFNTGVKAQVGLGESDLILMVMNNPEAESSATPRPHNRMLQGAVWKGKFAGNTLQPVLSYHTFKSNLDGLSSTSETESKLMAAGFKWADQGSFVQLDYIQLKATGLALAVPSDFQVTSVVFEGGYQMGAWTPRLKAEMSKVTETPDTGAKLENDVTGYSLAMDYRVPEASFARYHVALSQKTVRRDQAPDLTENHLIAGFTLVHDLLK
ncbi:MAG: hypothetical protein KF789_06660 [Bdellovibrionaceae bacterium]|nr:hypothetical protein [Pseudobdellovibrionaceae bacterium]